MTKIEDASDRRVVRADLPWHEEDGQVIIMKPKGGPVRRALLRLFRLRPDMRVHLDTLGSEVWHLLDGRTLKEVLRELEKAHPDTEALPARLGHYVSSLVNNGLAAFTDRS